MTCTLLMRSKEPTDMVALDLSSKTSENGDDSKCECTACFVGRLDIPWNTKNVLLENWNIKCRNSSSPTLTFDHDLTQNFLQQQLTAHSKRMGSPHHSIDENPCKIRKTSSAPNAMSKQIEDLSRPVCRSHSPPPLYASSIGTVPQARRLETIPIVTNDLSFGMLKPQQQQQQQQLLQLQQMSLNAWLTPLTLDRSKTSPSLSQFSPDRAISTSEEDAETRSSGSSGSGGSHCSSPASSSRTHMSPTDRCPKTRTTATASPTDKEFVYQQRRLRNNLAAKRSRDARRQREDKVAATCQRMEDVRQRLVFIRSEYIKLLQSS